MEELTVDKVQQNLLKISKPSLTGGGLTCSRVIALLLLLATCLQG